jgi:hypothetical protein
VAFVQYETDLAERMNLDLAHAIHLGQLADVENGVAHDSAGNYSPSLRISSVERCAFIARRRIPRARALAATLHHDRSTRMDPMHFVPFLRSTPGRVTRVAVGCLLVGIGALERSLTGLLLMMIGVVPVVTALANVCLLDDIAAAVTAAKRARTPPWVPQSRITRR